MTENVIKFEKPPEQDNPPPTPKMFNIPPLTFWTFAAIIVIYALQEYATFLSGAFWYDMAFVPERYMSADTVWPWGVTSPFTYMFLHGSWMHVLMNGFMFIAFGAASEKMLGRRDTIIIFIVTGLIAAFSQYILDMTTPIPMVGASGALSGLFAAVVVHMQRVGAMPKGRFGIWGIAALWIGISYVSAMIGGGAGMDNIAWAAHAGGFLGGVGLMLTVFKDR